MEYRIIKKTLLVFILFFSFTLSLIAVELNDSVSFNFVTKIKQAKSNKFYSIVLVIDNQSQDTINFNNFRKYMPHRNEREAGYQGFSWDIKTLRGERAPRYEVYGHSVTFHAKKIEKGKKYEKGKTIIVMPHSTMYIDIYLYNNILFLEGEFYKLYLYYGNNILNPIAETEIFYK